MRSGLTGAVIVACAALVALLGYGLATSGTDDTIEQALARGERPAAPSTRLPKLEGGGSGELADHRGKVVLVNFWATWCPPCRDEMPLLQRTHERMRSSDGLVLGIDSRDPADAALKFLRENGIEFSSLRDGDGAYWRELGGSGYPESFVVDRKGNIAAMRRGPVTEDWLRDKLDPVLAE